MKTGRLRIVGAALLGCAVGAVLVMASMKGFERIFPKNDIEEWGMLLWGEHWIIRLTVSLLATYFGGFVAGLAAPQRASISAGLSAVPTAVVHFLMGSFLFVNMAEYEPLAAGSWVSIAGISTLSIFVASSGGNRGGDWRHQHHYLFDIPGRPLGYHWTTLTWVWLPLYLITSSFTIGLYSLIYYDLSGTFSILSLSRGISLASLALLTLGPLKALWYLMAGHHLGLSRLQIAIRAFVFLVIFPLIGEGLQYLIR